MKEIKSKTIEDKIKDLETISLLHTDLTFCMLFVITYYLTNDRIWAYSIIGIFLFISLLLLKKVTKNE